jgi:hypothetical protein
MVIIGNCEKASIETDKAVATMKGRALYSRKSAMGLWCFLMETLPKILCAWLENAINSQIYKKSEMEGDSDDVNGAMNRAHEFLLRCADFVW